MLALRKNMKLKNQTIENFVRTKELLENKQGGDLIIGTEEYATFLDKIISDLKAIKGSLKTRSYRGKENRKEADRIQAAVNALKYLSGKSQRILNNSVMNESNLNDKKLTRSGIRNFLKRSRENE